MIEITYRAQAWLDSWDADNNNVVLLTDIQAAYDTVPHEQLTQMVA